MTTTIHAKLTAIPALNIPEQYVTIENLSTLQARGHIKFSPDIPVQEIHVSPDQIESIQIVNTPLQTMQHVV